MKTPRVLFMARADFLERSRRHAMSSLISVSAKSIGLTALSIQSLQK